MTQLNADIINLNDSLAIYQQSLTQSGTNSITTPSRNESESVETAPITTSITQQKIWMITNGLIWLIVSITSIALLIKKQSNLDNFYDHSQCCYCLWVAHNYHIRVEWSPCYATPLSLNPDNLHQVCNSHCKGPEPTDMLGTLSYKTASLIPKYYVEYGVFALFLVSIYLILLWMAIFKYKIQLTGKLFIGNIIVAIICYYPYIKLYQFHRDEYNSCENPPPFQHGQEQYCYVSALDLTGNTAVNLLAYYLELYMAYLVYAVCPCICFIIIKKCCHELPCCKKWAPRLDNAFFYVSLILAPIFAISSFVLLIYYVVHFSNDFGLVGFASNKSEVSIIIVIGVLLLFTAFNMFCMGFCRRQTKDIICCTETHAQTRLTFYNLYHDQLHVNN
eukprot:84873_1